MSNATVQDGKVIQYRYTFHGADQLPHLEVEDGPVAYLHGAGEILPGVEAAMTGKPVGAAFQVTLSPDDAFGERLPDDEADRTVPRDEIEGDIQVGDPIDALDDDDELVELWVKSLDGDEAVLTENHPLAGHSITLDLEVLDIRDANADEVEAGLAFGWSGDEDPDDEDEDELDWN